jgi:hypothetical protein
MATERKKLNEDKIKIKFQFHKLFKAKQTITKRT